MNKITKREIRENNNNYEGTISALLCFVSLTTWEEGQRNPNSFYSFGRRMTTSNSNQVARNEIITPDAVVQVLDNLGFIVEAKITLPLDQSYWNEILEQIKKYDDDLIGWWTGDEHINRHTVVLLIHLPRSNDFKSFMNSLIERGLYHPSANACGIEFILFQQEKEFILFRTSWGNEKIYDQALAVRLQSSVCVPLENVKVSYGNIKFYDCRPEPEYLLSIIWQDILTHLSRGVDFNKQLNCYPININIHSLTHELQKSYGSIALQRSCNLEENSEREVEYPQISWVKEALELLIGLKFAEKLSEDEYTVFFRQLKLRADKDLIDYFSRYRTTKEKITEEEEQPLLFRDV